MLTVNKPVTMVEFPGNRLKSPQKIQCERTGMPEGDERDAIAKTLGLAIHFSQAFPK